MRSPFLSAAVIFIQPCALPFKGTSWYLPARSWSCSFLHRTPKAAPKSKCPTSKTYLPELPIWWWQLHVPYQERNCKQCKHQHCTGKPTALKCTCTAISSLLPTVKHHQMRETPLCNTPTCEMHSTVPGTSSLSISACKTSIPVVAMIQYVALCRHTQKKPPQSKHPNNLKCISLYSTNTFRIAQKYSTAFGCWCHKCFYGTSPTKKCLVAPNFHFIKHEY